jgi:hypothetical protein
MVVMEVIVRHQGPGAQRLDDLHNRLFCSHEAFCQSGPGVGDGTAVAGAAGLRALVLPKGEVHPRSLAPCVPGCRVLAGHRPEVVATVDGCAL